MVFILSLGCTGNGSGPIAPPPTVVCHNYDANKSQCDVHANKCEYLPKKAPAADGICADKSRNITDCTTVKIDYCEVPNYVKSKTCEIKDGACVEVVASVTPKSAGELQTMLNDAKNDADALKHVFASTPSDLTKDLTDWARDNADEAKSAFNAVINDNAIRDEHKQNLRDSLLWASPDFNAFIAVIKNSNDWGLAERLFAKDYGDTKNQYIVQKFLAHFNIKWQDTPVNANLTSFINELKSKTPDWDDYANAVVNALNLDQQNRARAFAALQATDQEPAVATTTSWKAVKIPMDKYKGLGETRFPVFSKDKKWAYVAVNDNKNLFAINLDSGFDALLNSSWNKIELSSPSSFNGSPGKANPLKFPQGIGNMVATKNGVLISSGTTATKTNMGAFYLEGRDIKAAWSNNETHLPEEIRQGSYLKIYLAETPTDEIPILLGTGKAAFGGSLSLPGKLKSLSTAPKSSPFGRLSNSHAVMGGENLYIVSKEGIHYVKSEDLTKNSAVADLVADSGLSSNAWNVTELAQRWINAIAFNKNKLYLAFTSVSGSDGVGGLGFYDIDKKEIKAPNPQKWKNFSVTALAIIARDLWAAYVTPLSDGLKVKLAKIDDAGNIDETTEIDKDTKDIGDFPTSDITGIAVFDDNHILLTTAKGGIVTLTRQNP